MKSLEMINERNGLYTYIFLFSINWSTLIIRSILLRYRLLTWRDPSVEITETRGLVFIRVQKKKKAIFQTEKKEEVTTGFVVSLGGSLAYLFLVLCWLECMVDSRVANESISILPVRLARFFDHDLTPRVL